MWLIYSYIIVCRLSVSFVFGVAIGSGSFSCMCAFIFLYQTFDSFARDFLDRIHSHSSQASSAFEPDCIRFSHSLLVSSSPSLRFFFPSLLLLFQRAKVKLLLDWLLLKQYFLLDLFFSVFAPLAIFLLLRTSCSSVVVFAE
jgi:hypothetical protein